jgi:hypothetical protein
MLDIRKHSVYAAPMNTHNDPRTTPATDCKCGGATLSGSGHKVWCSAHVLSVRTPEWRRRSMEGRGRFDAVTDTTGMVSL